MYSTCVHVYTCIYINIVYPHTCTCVHVLMRDEKEGRKKQARSNKQQLRQSNTAHPRNNIVYRHTCTMTLYIQYVRKLKCTVNILLEGSPNGNDVREEDDIANEVDEPRSSKAL